MNADNSQRSLCDGSENVLVVIDIQQRLASVMPEKVLKQVIENTQFLIQCASHLNIPVIISEQYPKGLGSTLSELLDQLPSNVQSVEKTCFSCASNTEFQGKLKQLNKKQVVLTGMEAHICVSQTAIELLNEKYEVFIATDAVCSRKKKHYKNAINRLLHAGSIATNSESIAFEWLRDAKHEQFKAISKLLK